MFTALNPAGCKVTSFKQPSTEELDHDYLWRITKATPAYGEVGIFNRSHYEDVLVTRVHNLVNKKNDDDFGIKDSKISTHSKNIWTIMASRL